MSAQLIERPFLARFAVPRRANEPLPGHYDQKQDLWVIPTDDGTVPLVSAGRSHAELETKTKVDNEQDDSAASVLDLAGVTHTSVQMEQDDHMLAILLTGTFTEVTPEADDLH